MRVALSEALGTRLRELLASAGMGVDDLAAAVRMPQAEVQSFVDGAAWPCPRSMRALAAALGVDPPALMPYREEM